MDYELLLASMMAFIGVIIVVCIAFYVLGAIAYMKVFKYFNYDKVWLAWIPLGNYYGLAEVTGRESVNLGFTVPMSVFKFWWAIYMVCAFIPVVGSIAGFIILIACLGWNYSTIYAMLDGDYQTEFSVLGFVSVFIGIIPLIKFLMVNGNAGTRMITDGDSSAQSGGDGEFY